MAQAYKSYDFYDVSGSDNDEQPKKTGNPSRLTQKQEKKKIEKAARQESSGSDSSSGDEQKTALKGPPKDLESEYGSKNKKRVQQDDSANKKSIQIPKKKSDELQDFSTSDNVPVDQNQDLQKKTDKGIADKGTPKREQMSPAIIPQNSSVGTGSANLQMNVESQNIETSKFEDKTNSIPENLPSAAQEGPAKLQFREDREPASAQSKKKSGKYIEATSSESSLSPPASPKKVVPAPVASVESRQKSRLSSHLKSIKEAMKAQEQEKLDTEGNVILSTGDKLKFFVDSTPLGIIQEEGENKKLIPHVPVTEMEVEDRQYRILGQERAFRTQEKNLIDKLSKFFVAKEEEKKDEENKEGKEDEEDMKEIDEEFNFESRYFMYNPTKVCNRCKKAGHFERWCPEDVLIKCMFCVGHHKTDECTQVVCFQCYGVGHRARDCDAPGSLVCFRCGKRGHKSSNCGMIVLKESTLYREKKDGSGDIRCVKCGRYGHVKCNKDLDRKKSYEKDRLYDEEREELNMKILARAKDIQSFEFEGSISGESYEDLSNFKPASRSNYDNKSRDKREKEIIREIKREKKERKDKEKYSKKKKSKRYY